MPPPFSCLPTASAGRVTAGEHDSGRAPKLCAGRREGEIVRFDKAYVHFAHLWALTGRGVFRVTRAKYNQVTKVKNAGRRTPIRASCAATWPICSNAVGQPKGPADRSPRQSELPGFATRGLTCHGGCPICR